MKYILLTLDGLAAVEMELRLVWLRIKKRYFTKNYKNV